MFGNRPLQGWKGTTHHFVLLYHYVLVGGFADMANQEGASNVVLVPSSHDGRER